MLKDTDKEKLKAIMRKDLEEFRSEAKEFYSELCNTVLPANSNKEKNKKYLDKYKSRAKERVDFFEKQLELLED